MIHAALIGAGKRGMLAYASYALNCPDEIQFIAVAEPNEERRSRFSKLHNIPVDMQFASWEELLAKPKLCEALLICTMDREHYAPTMAALDKGYHILLEKPMSHDPLETIRIAEKAEETQRILTVCHGMRYNTFSSELKRLIDAKLIGDIMTIQWTENVGHEHYVSSFVRGNWRNSQANRAVPAARFRIVVVFDRRPRAILFHGATVRTVRGRTSRCVLGTEISELAERRHFRAFCPDDPLQHVHIVAALLQNHRAGFVRIAPISPDKAAYMMLMSDIFRPLDSHDIADQLGVDDSFQLAGIGVISEAVADGKYALAFLRLFGNPERFQRIVGHRLFQQNVIALLQRFHRRPVMIPIHRADQHRLT
jgi:hypothetical protein